MQKTPRCDVRPVLYSGMRADAARDRMVGLDTPDMNWTLDHIRQHIEQGVPLVPLFNIDVIEASPERGAVRLRQGDHVTRPGGSVAGPVQFALADVAAYALILAGDEMGLFACDWAGINPLAMAHRSYCSRVRAWWRSGMRAATAWCATSSGRADRNLEKAYRGGQTRRVRKILRCSSLAARKRWTALRAVLTASLASEVLNRGCGL
jgi:hypothetical protein